MRRVALAAFAAAALVASAQPASEQREAMKALAAMDGAWRGPAWTLQRDGTKHHLTQTERIGPFLEGSVKVIEGRGYEPDGRVGFNALGVVYYDSQKKAYRLRSWTLSAGGEFKFEVLPDGYAWEVEFPGGKVRYVGTIQGNRLREVGHTHLPGREPFQSFEMNLERIADTDWPRTTPVPQK